MGNLDRVIAKYRKRTERKPDPKLLETIAQAQRQPTPRPSRTLLEAIAKARQRQGTRQPDSPTGRPADRLE